MKQLSIFVENKVGSLAQVTNKLKENNISLKAVSVFDSPDFSIMRVIVEEPELAKDILTKAEFAVLVTEILAVELEDQPGSLNHLLEVMEEQSININYMYSFVYRQKEAPLIVLNVDEGEAARTILMRNHIKVVD